MFSAEFIINLKTSVTSCWVLPTATMSLVYTSIGRLQVYIEAVKFNLESLITFSKAKLNNAHNNASAWRTPLLSLNGSD